MENTVKERLEKFLDDSNITKSDFNKRIGVSNAYISSMRASISPDKLKRIVDEFPELNIGWLITGEGEMLKGLKLTNHHTPTYNEKLKDVEIVPYYSVEAAANLTTIFGSDTTEYIDSYIAIPNMPAVDGAVAIRGDSMYPLLKSGDIVVFKKLSSVDYIVYGQMYLIEYTWDDDLHIVVKYINRSVDVSNVKLVSYNNHHEPLDIPKEAIKALALVKASIRYNTMI